VLLAGGYDGRVALDNAEIYDPVTGTFGATGRLTVPRAGLASATLPGGRVLLAGGGSTEGLSANAEVYDPRTGEFGPTGSMSTVRYKLAAAALPDGRVLVLGGSDDCDWTGQYRSAELYDPASGQFSPTGSMRAAGFKIEAAVATLPTGAVVVAGSDRSGESYDPAVGTFITATGEVADEYQSAIATALADGRVLIAGGYDPSIDTTASTWLFRP
jgi:Kelch motif